MPYMMLLFCLCVAFVVAAVVVAGDVADVCFVVVVASVADVVDVAVAAATAATTDAATDGKYSNRAPPGRCSA